MARTAKGLYGQGTISTLMPLGHCSGDTGWRKRGVDQRVGWPAVPGQVTSPASLSLAAARSEPHGTSAVPQREHGTVPGQRVRAGCTQGGWGQGGPQVRALHQGGRVHIRGCLTGPGRAEQGQNSSTEQCQNSTEPVPEPVQNQCIMPISDTRPTTRPPDQPPDIG